MAPGRWRVGARMMKLAWAGVRQHLRALSGVVAGVALATALIVAGLVLGDVLRASLEARVDTQLGPVSHVLHARDRRVSADLADALEAVPLLTYEAVARGAESAQGVTLMGVDERMQRMAPDFAVPEAGKVALTTRTMAMLGVAAGDDLVVRVQRPGALPREAAIMQDEGSIIGLRLVVETLPDVWPAELGWRARPDLPHVAFVSLPWLQDRLSVPEQVNVLLSDHAIDSIAEAWELDDAGLSLDIVGDELLLTSQRILLDAPLVDALEPLGGTLASTWFADQLTVGDKTSPYAFVAAVGPGDVEARTSLPALGPRDVVITDWLADDLDAAVGDAITLRVPVLGAARGLRYVDEALTIKAVVPLEGPFADDSWMPAFEGLAGHASCRDWDPGIPVDLERIRDHDEDYWDEHGGTPKAWVDLSVAERLWGSSYGLITSARFGLQTDEADVRRALLAVDPASLGLVFGDVETPMRASASPANDFGQLFLGFEFLLVTSALMLATMVLSLATSVRARELGTLRAMGWPAARVRRLMWTEGAIVTTAGVVLGLPLAVLTARLLLWGLDAVWRDAIGAIELTSVLPPSTMVVGGVAAWVVSFAAVALSVRRLLAREPRDLLAGGDVPTHTTAPRANTIALVAFGLGVAVLLGSGTALRSPAGAIGFFIAGFCFLVAGLAAFRRRLDRVHGVPRSLQAWGWRSLTRRPARSTRVVALLSFGAFLVVGVGLGGGQAKPDPTAASSGTGGYAWWVETRLPVPHTLDSDSGRDAYGLRPEELPEGSVFPMRLLAGDDASCHQLGSAQTPSLLGIDPSVWVKREAFSGVDWSQLGSLNGRVAAIGDAGTVTWGLHLGVGDVLTFAGRDGQPVEVEIVGVTPNAVFQGSLVVAASDLAMHFPDPGGAQVFLMDGPPALGPRLSKALEDVGAQVRPASAQLARFSEVEHTYVAIFHALGGLGLALGGLGVGLVLLRSVQERAAELALLRAVGWTESRVRAALIWEYGWLVLLGLGLGAAAAALAVAPVVLAPDAHPPWGVAFAVLAATGVLSMLGVLVGARVAVTRLR